MSRGGEEVSPLNIPQWRAFPLRRSLREALGHDVYVDGDARALALAEGAFGAARRRVLVSLDGGLHRRRWWSGHRRRVARRRVRQRRTHRSPQRRAERQPLFVRCVRLSRSRSVWLGDRSVDRSQLPPRPTRRRGFERPTSSVAPSAHSPRYSTSAHCYIAGSVALGFGDEFFDVANKSARALARLPYSEHLEISRSGLGTDGASPRRGDSSPGEVEHEATSRTRTRTLRRAPPRRRCRPRSGWMATSPRAMAASLAVPPGARRQLLALPDGDGER